jgi:hypothetical protein
MGESLNTRELATVIWLCVLLVVGLTQPGIRRSLGSIARLLVSPVIWIPLTLLAANVVGLATLGHRLGLWRASLVSETVIWFVSGALVLFFKLESASKEPRFFRRAAIRTLELTVFVEFFFNLTPFSLPIELALQPFLALIVALSVYAGYHQQYKDVKRFLDWLLGLVAVGVAAFTLARLIMQWDRLDKTESILGLALPVWMTLGVLPLIYLLSVWVAYSSTFGHINWLIQDDSRRRRRVKLALTTTLHGRTRDVAAFRAPWPQAVAAADSFWQARKAVKRYRASRR